jgi:hypothetical protein
VAEAGVDRFEELEGRRRLRDVGGTSGGLGTFLIGCVMLVAGGYWLLSRVSVTTHSWRIFGYDGFGLSLVPLLFGIGLLFFNGKSPLGWLLTAVGVVIIFAGVISSLSVFIAYTSLFNMLVILILLVGGIGLIARSMRSL